MKGRGGRCPPAFLQLRRGKPAFGDEFRRARLGFALTPPIL
jgi:hypothetical protein